MGTVSPDELAHMWREETLTPDMAIGYLTQNVARMQQALEAQQQALAQLRKILDSLTPNAVQPQRTPSSTPKTQRK